MNNKLEELDELEYCDRCYDEVPRDKIKKIWYKVGKLIKQNISIDLCPQCFSTYRTDQALKKAIREHDPNDIHYGFHLVQYYGYGERDTALERELGEIIKTKIAMSRKTVI